jgi:hypothetical protein
MLAAKEAAQRRLAADFSGYHPAIPLTVAYFSILITTGLDQHGDRMNTLTATDAKYGFGRLTDLARAKSVAVAKHGRPAVAKAAPIGLFKESLLVPGRLAGFLRPVRPA